jgi:hypothetical protein
MVQNPEAEVHLKPRAFFHTVPDDFASRLLLLSQAINKWILEKSFHPGLFLSLSLVYSSINDFIMM